MKTVPNGNVQAPVEVVDVVADVVVEEELPGTPVVIVEVEEDDIDDEDKTEPVDVLDVDAPEDMEVLLKVDAPDDKEVLLLLVPVPMLLEVLVDIDIVELVEPPLLPLPPLPPFPPLFPLVIDDEELIDDVELLGLFGTPELVMDVEYVYEDEYPDDVGTE